MTAPGYWMHETSGVLHPAVEAYLTDADMTPEQVAAMRAYLRQWMEGDWRGENVETLRRQVDDISDRASLDAWLALAQSDEIDPL